MVRESTTAKFPGSMPTKADLGVYTNDVRKFLAANVAAGDTVFTMTPNVTGYEVNMFLSTRGVNGFEVFRVTAVNSGASQITVARAQDGTSAVAHLEGQEFGAVIPAKGLNQMGDEIIAVTGAVQGIFINVKASPYNAVGDGVADDTAAVQSAINAGVTASGTVFFPPGTYRFATPVTHSLPSNLTIKADRATISAVTTAFTFGTFAGTQTQNLKILGLRVTNTNNAANAIQLRNVRFCDVDIVAQDVGGAALFYGGDKTGGTGGIGEWSNIRVVGFDCGYTFLGELMSVNQVSVVSRRAHIAGVRVWDCAQMNLDAVVDETLADGGGDHGYGLWLVDINWCTVRGSSTLAQKNNIRLLGNSQWNTFHGVFADGGRQTDNTYSNIFLDNNGGATTPKHNTFNVYAGYTAAPVGNKPKFGIEVAAGASNSVPFIDAEGCASGTFSGNGLFFGSFQGSGKQRFFDSADSVLKVYKENFYRIDIDADNTQAGNAEFKITENNQGTSFFRVSEDGIEWRDGQTFLGRLTHSVTGSAKTWTMPNFSGTVEVGLTFNVKAFGAVGDGVTDDTAAIQAAINAATRGGTVFFPPGTYAVAGQILPKSGTRLIGSGAGNYSTIGTEPTVIRPISGFTPSSVILIDPANEGAGSFISGVTVSYITFDMTNVKTASKKALEIKSLSNTEPFYGIRVLHQDNGNYIFIGKSANGGAQVSDGITFIDFYSLSDSVDPANSNPGIIIEEANEIAFRDCKVTRRSSGAFASGSIGVLIRSQSSGVNAVTFDGVSFAGYETGASVTRVGGQTPRWIRWLNCTFETYNIGISLNGDATASAQFCFVGPGNRFISPFGATPHKVRLDYAANCTVIEDEFAPSGGIVRATANSTANLIQAQPSQVTNSGVSNVVYGRNAAFFEVGAGDEAAPGIAVNAAAGATFPQVSLRRDGVEKVSLQATDAFSAAEAVLFVGANKFRFSPSGHFFIDGQFLIGGTTLFEEDRDLAVSLIPNASNSLDLGSDARRFRSLYLGTSAILGGDVTISRGAADRFDIASGDSLRLVNGSLQFGNGSFYYSLSGAPSADRTLTLPNVAGGIVLQQLGNLDITNTPSAGQVLSATSATQAAWTAAGGGGLGLALASEAYVTIGNTAGLTAERALTMGTGLRSVDGGANSTITLNADQSLAPQTDAGFSLGTASLRYANVVGNVHDVYGSLGDANPVARLSSSGIALGAGGGTTTDVLLQRGAADRLDLATGDTLNIVNGSLLFGGTTVVNSSRSVFAFDLWVNGINMFESDRDLAVSLLPSADSSLSLGSSSRRYINAVANNFLVFGALGEANAVAQMTSSGLQFGAGGGSAVDTRLYRKAAAQLASEPVFTVEGNTGLPAAGGVNLFFAGGYLSPVAGRIIIGDGTGWRMHFSKRTGSTTTDEFAFTDQGNLGLGTNTFGTNAEGVIALFNGVEPTTSPADTVQLFSVDISAGNASLGLRTEAAVATEAVPLTNNRSLQVRINGTTYKLMLSV